MFKKVLIANRGEIALRILRACHEMGISTVAVHSTADAEAMHVRLADESVCIGPPGSAESYLNKASIISAALLTNSDAIHPGYGFLSENSEFANIINEHGMTFIGPSPKHIKLMGDKIRAKSMARELGIPVIPGSNGAINSEKEALEISETIGFPVLIKATAGGGGRGMRIAHSKSDMSNALKTASNEALSAFGNGDVYIEKYLDKPRHIEVQVLSDNYGNVIHLYERDCSLQRNHQKVLEECPSPIINSVERKKIGDICSKAIRKLEYRNAGTLEFLYENGEFYFIEMNTRLQVEHPITEMVTGVDIVREQIRIASGLRLEFTQKDIKISGHAIECRINAEDSKTFLPSPGSVSAYHVPGGIGVRVDSSLFSGAKIPPFYDSMVAKLILHSANRQDCIRRTKRALKEFVIDDINTTIPLHQRIINSKDFINGSYDIKWLEKFIKETS